MTLTWLDWLLMLVYFAFISARDHRHGRVGREVRHLDLPPRAARLLRVV